jgi:hypothetical protein
MVVEWKCTILFDRKTWRWRATADGYLGLSGTAGSEDEAEAAARIACWKAVAGRVTQSGETRQFVIAVDESEVRDGGNAVEPADSERSVGDHSQAEVR